MRIVFFDIDCLRPDHLGCYGYTRPTSRTIDYIASRGVYFKNYYCQSSPCLPSRAGLISGRFGIRNGVLSNLGIGAKFNLKTSDYNGPHPDNELLPRQLRRQGMDTYAFSSFADRHSAAWFMFGWTEYHTPNLKGGHATAEEINNRLMSWMKKNAKKDDYLLYINYWDVHRPYKMPIDWAKSLKDYPIHIPWPDEDAIKSHQIIKGPFTAQQQFTGGISPYPLMPGSVSSRNDFEHLINGYDTSIVYVDHHVQQVIEELDSQGILEDTALIITGDHGDAFGEHGIYSDHVCADNCIHNIPLIVKWPGVTDTTRCDELIVNTDLSSTICDILDFPIPLQWDGRSFKNCLSGNLAQGREYIIWDCGLYAIQRAVRTKTHLLVHTYDNIGYPFGPVEFYNMQEDPYQTQDISSEQTELVDSLNSHMLDWIQEQSAKGPIDDPVFSILRERLLCRYDK